jgi:acyl-CoA synthetase
MNTGWESWGLRSTPEDVARVWRANGWWTDDTLGQLLASNLVAAPDLPVGIHSDIRPWRGTYSDVFDLSRRVAGSLRARGIGPGDPVAFQLPNWIEAAATFYAVTLLGAVVVPIVHFYGPKEVGYILERTGVRALVTAERFGHVDYLANLDELRPRLPALETVAVVGQSSFDDLAGGAPIEGPVSVDPDAPALVAYTSGTTAEPKGVVHTHRTIGFEVRQLAATQPKDVPPQLVGAPVGHGIGMLAALLLPVRQHQPIHLIDVWDPAKVLATMLEHRLLSGTGATYFLTSLLDHPDCTPEHHHLMRRVGLGGSAVPAAVGERAAALGISTVRMYGSTEHPSTTGCTHDDAAAKRLHTDGRPLQGCEVRLGDDGEILSRGPDRFAGYTDPSLTAAAIDADGWYATGDIGVLDEDGYLSVVDRKKDVIIRGGENISALEVEELLLRMPGVAEVAVVAAPDRRLGEHACAFLRPRPDEHLPDLHAVRAHLDAAGLARQKWPEELHEIADFPRTPSGKVQKFVLRERLRGVGMTAGLHQADRVDDEDHQ